MQHEAFDGVFRRERATVAVDNAAILIGRAVREEGRRWDALARELATWEVVHHVVHACARLPGAATACLTEDQALEKALLARLAWFRVETELLWARMLVLAPAEGSRLGESVRSLALPIRPPGTWEVCPICGLASRPRWEPPSGVRVLGKEGTSGGPSVGIEWRRRSRDRVWDYRMEVEAHESSRIGSL